MGQKQSIMECISPIDEEQYKMPKLTCETDPQTNCRRCRRVAMRQPPQQTCSKHTLKRQLETRQ
jgi:hypothetical protein